MKNNIKNIIFISSVVLFSLVNDFAGKRLEAQTPPFQVQVTDIQFTGGIGRGPTSSLSGDQTANYYRGYGLPGTTIKITADMNVGGTWGHPMYGDVQLTVSYTGAASGTFPLTIKSGSNTGTAAVPYNTATGFTLVSGTTSTINYTVSAVTGDYTSAVLGPVTSEDIFWNYNNPPVPSPLSYAIIPFGVTTNSFALSWTPVDLTNPLVGHDFYEYRIYYKEATDPTYKRLDGSNISVLRGIDNNTVPGTLPDAALQFDAAGLKYATISNLKVFTGYNYYITAVDIYGNESAYITGSQSTNPLSVNVTISDGITSYSNFSDLLTPTLRTLRVANTKVEIYTINAAITPDECIVWFSPNGATDMLVALVPNTATLGNDLDSVAAVRTGSNVWTAYLPTIPSTGKNPIIANGGDIRFVVELKNSGISTFIDSDAIDGDPNDDEWTYTIGTVTKFTAWPTRILNNVITDSNPSAYPSYYLTEDAYVSIRIYDIKGRPIATVLESAFRRGGQNIKENGWRGINKSGMKVGVGLYYINIKAKSYKNGKIILNDFKKVVMSR